MNQAHHRSEESPAERSESLWFLILAPLIWAIHFLLCYLAVAIWCGKFASNPEHLAPVRWTFLLLTTGAVAGIVWVGWNAYRRIRKSPTAHPYDAGPLDDRHRFLGFATVLLAGLSLIATLFVAAVALFMETCH